MPKPGSHRRHAETTLTRVLALLALLVLVLLPLAAAAGVAGVAPRVAAGLPEASERNGKLRIRCWQDGRLLFEVSGVTLSGLGLRPVVKIDGTDGNGQPLYVAETRNATCLIRGVGEPAPR